MRTFVLLLTLIPMLVYSQSDKPKNIVKITGVTVTNDSLKPIPFVNVLIKGNYTGTTGDYSGFYSIVAKTGDTLVFSSIGYQREEYVISDTLESKQYSLIQILSRDTVELSQTTIKVWPSYEQFKQAFLNDDVKDSDLVRAKKNLDHGLLREHALNLQLGAAGNQTHMLDKEKARLYSAGQLPANNFLNPLAWRRFIQAWKDGEYEDKKN